MPATLPSPLPPGPSGPAPAPRAPGGQLPRPLPAELHALVWAPEGGWEGHRGPVVVLVHGSLDRAASFTRVVRRLPEDWGIVAYDRRGYQGSRAGGPAPLAQHVDDLRAVAAAAGGPGRRVTAVGHSMGGVVVLGAAVAEADRFASVGAFEPPMPWLGFSRRGAPFEGDPPPADPAAEAERFFRRMVSDTAWEGLPETAKASRRADGPALVAELAALRRGTPAPFDVTALSVPALFGCGGLATEGRRRRTAAWLAGHVADGHLAEIPEAGHGAHLSHPSAFARFVTTAVALADGTGAPMAVGPAGAAGAGPGGPPTSRQGGPR